MKDFRQWIKWAGIRAIKTFFETALSLITVGSMVTELDWTHIFGISATSALISLFTCVANLPEAKMENILNNNKEGEESNE